MARPMKDGVDYFPLDVDTDNDIKFRIIEAKYGLIGFGIIIKLYQAIYRNGYYCEWNELISVISASEWSSQQFPVTDAVVRAVVKEAAKYGIFDKELLNKYGILTSKGIQKRYFEVSKRRLKINVKKEYLLVNAPETAVNVNINGVNVNINPENVYDNSQSKVNKSKVNKRESREKNFSPSPTLKEITDLCRQENLNINPEKFFHYYSAKNWSGISDWKAKAREWSATEKPPEEPEKKRSFAAYDLDLFEKMLNEGD